LTAISAGTPQAMPTSFARTGPELAARHTMKVMAGRKPVQV